MLIICPECGAQISDRAIACPHCGYSLAEVRQERQKKEAAEIAEKEQAAYDAAFRPNDLYLASPMPFKALFRAFTIKGRASRAEFWSYFVFYFSVVALMSPILTSETSGPMKVICETFFIYGLIALATVFFRRDHDVDDEGGRGCLFVFSFICLFIPIIGWLVFLTSLFMSLPLLQPSFPGSNKHGPPPDFWYNQYDNAPDIAQDPQSPTRADPQLWAGEYFNVACPYCGENCEVPSTVIEGQHVICPYCGEKFVCRGMG